MSPKVLDAMARRSVLGSNDMRGRVGEFDNHSFSIVDSDVMSLTRPRISDAAEYWLLGEVMRMLGPGVPSLSFVTSKLGGIFQVLSVPSSEDVASIESLSKNQMALILPG